MEHTMQTENYYIDYRHVPGSLGSGTSLDHGAVVREARRTLKSAQSRYEALVSDETIQWATLQRRDRDRLAAYQRPGTKSWADR